VTADGSSHEGPEVLRVLVLPVVPHLVDHLKEASKFSVSSLLSGNGKLESHGMVHEEEGI